MTKLEWEQIPLNIKYPIATENMNETNKLI